jgi:hypothetical protein
MDRVHPQQQSGSAVEEQAAQRLRRPSVYVPAKGADSGTENDQPASRAVGVRFVKMDDGAAVFNVTSGTYKFVAR